MIMKRYLLTMTVLLCAALAAGVVVWFLYQNLEGARPVDLDSLTPQEVVRTTGY